MKHYNAAKKAYINASKALEELTAAMERAGMDTSGGSPVVSAEISLFMVFDQILKHKTNETADYRP